jgi:hypothetical protein
MLVPYLAIAFIIISLFLQPLSVFFEGYKEILLSESILLTDYVHVGGLGPALFNSGTLMLIAYAIVRKLGLKVTGSIFAGILTIGGFAFFGKNLINVTIIYSGVLLYAKYKKIKLKSVIVVFFFSTGLSPVSSLIMFGVGIPLLYSIPIGILIGVLSGFFLVELASHVMTFHRGYDLYNVGFASGILSFAYFSIFRLIGVDYSTNLLYTNTDYALLTYIFIAICVVYLLIGIYLNDGTIKGYNSILRRSGKAITDFTRRSNQPITMINIGLTGLSSLVLILLLGVHMNGPVIGGLLTIIGFSAFGKHVRNVLPPMIGVMLVTWIFGVELSIPVVLAILFASGLAPISGEYGFIIGILTGMLHLPVAIGLSELHGGVLLYSNGFAAAFTAVIVTTIISTIRRSDSYVST